MVYSCFVLFSPFLFTQGQAPGPQILLKLLRNRFMVTGTAQRGPLACGADAVEQSSMDYSTFTATNEYNHLVQQRQQEKERRHKEGILWQCCDCHQKFPPAGYNADAASYEEIREKCLAPGHWRRCRACSGRSTLQKESSQETRAKQWCEECQQERDSHYFLDGCDVCASCCDKNIINAHQCSSCTVLLRKKQLQWSS